MCGLSRRSNLSYNRLSGEIFAALGQLKYLDTRNLYNNQLSGEIFAALGQLKYLDARPGNLTEDVLSGLIVIYNGYALLQR